MSVTFRKVDSRVWLVYVGTEYWGKLWQSLPDGIWRLIDKAHNRSVVGLSVPSSKAKALAVTYINSRHFKDN